MNTIITFIVVLGVLIFVHEFGHFLFAKLFRVQVLKFSLGFGPKIFGKTLGETEYLVSAFPLGGYVKMLGESPEDEEVDPDLRKRSFAHKPVIQRFCIVLAGPLFNLLFSVFLPGLIFEAAFHIEFTQFWRNRLAIAALAVPGVVAAIALTALILTPVANRLHFVQGFTWQHAMVFGALIAATDPIAVIAIFRSLGVPQRLAVLMDADEGLGLSRRRITVSTSGLIPQIERLGAAYPVNLAVSLHAADDALRDELVPINRKYPLASLRRCLDAYAVGRQRHITLEYVMLDGINDRDTDLAALARFVRPERERVNLISFNPYPGNPYHASSRERMDAFAQGLIRQGIRATVRRSRGQDVMAACGQLKSASEAVLQEDPHQYA